MLSDKIKVLMTALGAKNIDIALFANIDETGISHLRRTGGNFKVTSKTVNHFVDGLLKFCHANSKTEILYELCNISSERSSLEIRQAVLNWLFDQDNSNYLGTGHEVSEQTLSNIYDDVSYCYGNKGLRAAFCKLLKDAIKNKATEIFLYSDQSFNWMSENTAYHKRIIDLLWSCLSTGISLTIIHATDRHLIELVFTVKTFFPLYASGLAKPYFYPAKNDTCFSHTLLYYTLESGGEFIKACNVKGAEDKGIYFFSSNISFLNGIKEEGACILKKCIPLVDFYTQDNLQNYPTSVNKLIYTSGDMSILLGTLSAATMNEKLLMSILTRNGITDKTKRDILSFYKVRRGIMHNIIQANRLTEFITIPSVDDVKKDSLPISIDNMLLNYPIYYTKGEYLQHLSQIETLTLSNPNYKAYFIKENPLGNIYITLDDTRVTLMRKRIPFLVAQTANISMRFAVQELLDQLKNNSTDPEMIRKLINQA